MPVEDGKKYSCTTVRKRRITATTETYIYVRTNAQGVQMVSAHEKLFKTRQSLVVQGIVEVIFS